MDKLSLKPCPFCGSSKIEFRDIAQQTLVAVCCGCNAEGGYTTLAAGSTSRDEAAEFWNTRSEGLPPPGGGEPQGNQGDMDSQGSVTAIRGPYPVLPAEAEPSGAEWVGFGWCAKGDDPTTVAAFAWADATSVGRRSGAYGYFVRAFIAGAGWAALPPSPGEREAVTRRIADGFWHGNLNWEELTESQRDACMSAAEAVLLSPSNPGKEG